MIYASRRLMHPYFEAVEFAGYVLMFGYVVSRLRACYRVATTFDPEWASFTARLTFLASILRAMGDVSHLDLLFRSGDSEIVRSFTSIAMLLGLAAALDLVETVLKEARPLSSPEGDWDRVSPPSG